MSRIAIYNKTKYQNRDIRRIVSTVMKEYWRTHTKPERVSITCIYRRVRDGFCGGYAYYNSGVVVLKISKDADRVHSCRKDDDPAMNIARTLLHELCHCRGLKHGDMAKDETFNVEYVRGFFLRFRQEPKPKERTDEAKIIQLYDRKKRWFTKAKRAETAIRKINKSLHYYERKMAACGTTNGEQQQSGEHNSNTTE